VSIFELADLMGKHYPVNHVSLKLIDCIKPDRITRIKEDEMLEYESFKLAQMKITSKVARFNFDERSFIDYLDINGNDKIKLHDMFSVLADKFSIYFSVPEQLAIRNVLFPDSKNESVQQSKSKQVVIFGDPEVENSNVRTFSEVLIISQAEFLQNLHKYTIKRQEFLDMVVQNW
jgi:hypothetical protein